MCDERQVLLLVAQQVVPVVQRVAQQVVPVAQQVVPVAVAAEELQEELSFVEMAVAGGDYLGGLAGASGERSSSHRSCEPQRSRC